MDSNESPASIDNLPYDVLSAIFLHSFEGIRLPARFGWPLPEPWNLASVCSKWRQTALETPALWNNLAIRFPIHFNDDDARRQLEVAKLCLSRTGQSLISLNIGIEVDGLSQAGYCLERHVVMSMEHGILRPYIGRLRKLSFQFLEGFRWFLDLEPGTVDALESVSITFYRRPTSNITVFTGARSLRVATVSSSWVVQVCDPHVFHFPWTQLTRLNFISTLPMFKETHEVLRQCRSLISLKICIQADKDCDQHMLADTYLRCLESLEVFTLSEGNYGMFLMPFILPSLKYLVVMTSRRGTLWPSVPSAQCLGHLEEVYFSGLEPQAVQAFLKVAPLIEECTLNCLEVPTGPFNDLIAAITCGDLVPALRVFACDSPAVGAMLIRMLETRGKFVNRSPSRYATIESVLVQTGSVGGMEASKVEHIRQTLAKVGDRGMEVAIRP